MGKVIYVNFLTGSVIDPFDLELTPTQGLCFTCNTVADELELCLCDWGTYFGDDFNYNEED